MLTAPRTYLAVASVQAVAALCGSLWFSDVIGYMHCELCWWQRIFMYPLAVMLPVALFTKEKSAFLRYAVPLVCVGLAVSIFHNSLYYASMWQRLHPTATVTTCSFKGTSCTAVYIEWFGFITIPLLALVAFSVIAASLGLYAKRLRATA